MEYRLRLSLLQLYPGKTDYENRVSACLVDGISLLLIINTRHTLHSKVAGLPKLLVSAASILKSLGPSAFSVS